jgi:hypothetical protein
MQLTELGKMISHETSHWVYFLLSWHFSFH